MASGLEQMNIVLLIPLVDLGCPIPGSSCFAMLLQDVFVGHLTHLVVRVMFKLRNTAADAVDNLVRRGADARPPLQTPSGHSLVGVYSSEASVWDTFHAPTGLRMAFWDDGIPASLPYW